MGKIYINAMAFIDAINELESDELKLVRMECS